MQDLVDWLETLGLAQHAKLLEANGIDLSVLQDVTDQDLEKLGIVLGHRRKILRAIAERVRVPRRALAAAEAPQNAERRHMTVMFCDLVGSTALSSRLDPEDMSAVILAFQDCCAGAVARYGGFVAKFLGDGVLVYFGYPRAHEADAERAVRAGLEIAAAIRRLQTPATTRLDVRIGVATGLVVVGEAVGSGASQEQAVFGDTVNLAARLQTLAEPGNVVVARATRRLLGDLFALRELGPRPVKGLAEPVEVWVVEGVSPAETRFEAVHPSNLTAFVGRGGEALSLDAWRRRAWQGAGQVVLISGEPGIGKSRFVRQFGERVAEVPHTRVRYQCSPFHTASALYPFIEQMKRAAGFDPADAPDAQLDKLEAVLGAAQLYRRSFVPLFAALLSVPLGGRYEPPGLSAGQQRQQTLAALLDFLEALSRQRPVLAILEDVHWADPTSLELIGLAIERIRQLNVLVLITYRPEFEPPWTGLANVHQAALGRLEPHDVLAMIGHLASGKSVPPEVAAHIVAKTDGVPLFVEELTKMVLESGLVVEEQTRFRLDAPLHASAIPDTLQDSLMARLDRLAFVKEVAQVGAAIGREFSYALLKLVTGRDGATLDAALDRLAAAQLIYRTGSSVDLRYSFKHALVQNAAYESLLRSRRQVLHRRIAETLRDKFPQAAETEPEVVAHHFAEAGLHEAATEWWRKAAEGALARSAYVEAIAHYATATALAEKLPDTPEQRLALLHLQISYGQALLAAHSHGAPLTTAAFDRAGEIAASIGNSPERFHVYYGLWGSRHVRGEMAAARSLADALLRDAEREPDSAEAGLAHRVAGITRWSEGDFPAARSHLERTLEIHREEVEPSLRTRYGLDPWISAAMVLAVVEWQLGAVARAEGLAAAALRRAMESKHIPTLAFGHGWTCLFEAARGNGDRVLPHAQILVDVSSEHRLPLWHSFGTAFLDWACWQVGNRTVGRARMREVVGGFHREGLALYLTFYPALLAEMEAGAGDVEAGLALLGDAIALAERTGQDWFSSDLHRKRGELMLLREPADLAEAERCFARAIAVARRQQGRTAELRATLGVSRLYRATGRTEAAAQALAAAMAGVPADADYSELRGVRELTASLEAAAVAGDD